MLPYGRKSTRPRWRILSTVMDAYVGTKRPARRVWPAGCFWSCGQAPSPALRHGKDWKLADANQMGIPSTPVASHDELAYVGVIRRENGGDNVYVRALRGVSPLPLTVMSALRTFATRDHPPPRSLVCAEKEKESESWALPFGLSYRRSVDEWHARTGQFGPLDIYSPRYRRLFLQFACKERRAGEDPPFLDWQRLDTRWGCRDAVVMCLDLCSKLGDSARQRIVTRKCNQELRARSLPTAASTTI